MQELSEVFTPKVIASIKRQRSLRVTESFKNGTTPRKIRVFKDGLFAGVFPSITKASKELKLHPLKVSNALNHGSTYKKSGCIYTVTVI